MGRRLAKRLLTALILFSAFSVTLASPYDEPDKSGYQYNSSIRVFGRIFVDKEDHLHVITSKGTFVYGRNNQLLKSLKKSEILPIRSDVAGNLFYVEKRLIKKIAKKKEENYRIDFPKGSTFLGLDNSEYFYFIAPRLKFEEPDLRLEIEDLIRERDEKTQELENYHYNQDAESRDISEYNEELLDLKLQKMEYHYDMDRYLHMAEYMWNRLDKFGEKILMDEKEKIEEQLQNIYQSVREKKELVYQDIDERAFEIEKEINTKGSERDTAVSALSLEIAIGNFRLKELEGKIEKDNENRYILLVLDNNELVAKRHIIPRPPAEKGPPLYECAGIRMGDDGNIYGFLEEKVYIYNEQGELINCFGRFGTHPGEIGEISDLAVDSKGVIYISDIHNQAIHIFLAP